MCLDLVSERQQSFLFQIVVVVCHCFQVLVPIRDGVIIIRRVSEVEGGSSRR